jgi:hypothetical protein
MGVLGCAVALASESDPLPALLVERPLATPRGWTELALDHRALDRGGAWSAELRYGVLRRVELGLRLGVRDPTGGPIEPADPRLRVRLTLLRTEPPNQSVVFDLGLTAPTTAHRAPVPSVGFAGARQVGPVLLSLRGSVAPTGPEAGGTALLQVGPLAPFGSVRVEAPWGPLDDVVPPAAGAPSDPRTAGVTGSAVTGSAGLVVQLSRGLELHGRLGARPGVGLGAAF